RFPSCCMCPSPPVILWLMYQAISPATALLACFFFYCAGAPLYLPSFPTRRSSDSLVDAVNCAIALERPLLLRGEPGTGKTLLARSEEHTSELQSRRDLVCRLLLDTKKKNRTAQTHGS